jgi:hypothetical protein
MSTKRFLLLLFFPLTLFAQGGAVSVVPDCIIPFSFSATGRVPTAGFPNKTQGCVQWTVTYWVASTVSALSLDLDSAADAAGVAGTWVAFTGTVLQGANPSTTVAQSFFVVSGYNPWVSVNLTSKTGAGTVNGFAYGFRTAPLPPTQGGVASSVNIAQVGGAAIALGQATMAASLPVVIASNQTAVPDNITQMAGSSLFPCLSLATANLSGSGQTQVIAASGSTTIRVCHISIAGVASEDIKITQGTGSNCATPGTPADLTGLYKSVSAIALDFGPFSPLKGSASQALCVSQSLAQATGVTVLYDQR